MTRRNFPKLIVTMALVLLCTVMLAGCSKGNAFPSEGINLDKVYLSNGSISVTEGEMYKTLKNKYGLDELTKAINKVVFKEQIDKYNANKNDAKYKSYAEYYVDKACYNLTDKDKINEYDLTTKIKSQKTFLDTLATYGVNVDYTMLSSGEYDIYQDAVCQYYIVDIAIKIYADEIAKKSWDGYVTIEGSKITDRYSEEDFTDAVKAELEKEQTEKIVEEYNKNYKNRGDMLGVLVRFNDANEYDEVLKLLCLKTSGGKWYQIPYDAEAEDFDKYYANYKITNETALTDVEVFAYFMIMFNYINSYRSSIINDMGWSTESIDDIVASFKSVDRSKGVACVNAIKAEAGNEDGTIKYGTVDENDVYTPSEFIAKLTSAEMDPDGDFTLTYDEYYSKYFTIYNHFYSTLKTTGQKFSTKGITYSNSITGNDGTFIGFKLAENKIVKLFNEETVETTDGDGEEAEETKYTFLETEAAVALKAEIIEAILENDVKSMVDGGYEGLVAGVYNYEKLYKNKKIKIYDTDLQLLYSLKNADYKKTSASSKDAVAEVNGTKILAKDLCDSLLNAYAPIVSLSTAFDKWLVAEYQAGRFENQITAKELKESSENAYNYYMSYFANGTDQISGYNLPASVGKKAFMKIAFGATTMKEAIKNYFEPLVLKQLFYSNLDPYYANEGASIGSPYEKLAVFAKNQYDAYFSLTYQNLLIYIDMNGDEELEDPTEYLETLNAAEQAEFKALIEDFCDEIKQFVSEAKSLTTGVSNFATEYNKASRFDERWGKYKKSGLFIKLEASTTSTNTASLVEPFLNRLEEVYNENSNWDATEDPQIKGNFIPFFDHEIGRSYENILVTEYGYHLVLFTAAANKPNAKFDLEASKYKNILYSYKNNSGEVYATKTVDNVLSSTPYPSANQIEVYIRDAELYGSNLNLYTDTYNSVKSTFADVYTRYTSSTHRTMLILEILIKDGFNYEDNANAIRTDKTIEITKLQMDNYADAEDNLYNGWFEAFGYTSKFAK